MNAGTPSAVRPPLALAPARPRAPERDVHWTAEARRRSLDLELDACRIPDAYAAAVRDFDAELLEHGYLASPSHVIGVYSAIASGRPLFLYGAPGAGKTYLAEVLSMIFNPDSPLLAVSMNEEVGREDLLYRDDQFGREVLWKQIHAESTATGTAIDWDEAARRVQSKVVPGPLATAIIEGNATGEPRVVLIDEIDKAAPGGTDPLLYFLNSGEIPIPYYGILRPRDGCKPIVVLTANTEYITIQGRKGNEKRRLSEALESRVFAVQVQLPTVHEEAFVLRKQVPELDEAVLETVLLYTHRVRESLRTNPISEREVRNFALALADFGYRGPGALSGPLVRALAGYYAKNASDEYTLKLHCEEALAWAYREVARHGSARAALDEVDALQRRLRAGEAAELRQRATPAS